MIDKSKDKVGYLKDRFNDCIKNGYEHFGFEGDFHLFLMIQPELQKMTSGVMNRYVKHVIAMNSMINYMRMQ